MQMLNDISRRSLVLRLQYICCIGIKDLPSQTPDNHLDRDQTANFNFITQALRIPQTQGYTSTHTCEQNMRPYVCM